MTAKITKKYNGGFTLIEALIAISILMIAIASPMVISQKGLTDAVLSRDEATASFLAQDGIEAVKNVRDTTALSAESGSPTYWLSNLNACICSGASCVDPSNPSNLTYCNIDTMALNPMSGLGIRQGSFISKDPNPMQIVRDKKNGGNFLYFGLSSPNPNTSQTPSIFSRYINVVQAPSNLNKNQDEAEVNVIVKWNEASGPQNVTITDFIYNYSPYANSAQ
jgi:type II secretory pathway pseudopilin PulG